MFKKFLQLKNISEEQFKAMEAAKQAELHTQFLDDLAEKMDKLAQKSELTTIITDIKTLKESGFDKTEFDLAVKKFDDLAIDLEAVKNKGGRSSENEMANELKENSGVLKDIASGGKGEIVIKAISNRASVVGNEQAVDLPGIGQLAHRQLSMYDAFPKIRISSSNNNGVIRYYDWDEATTIRAAKSVAEGTPFPESTAKFKKGTIVIEKIGDTLPVTEEFFEDEEMFASELSLFLDTNVQLEIDDQLCNGDGTNNKLVGLYPSAPAYVPVAAGIEDANIFDLLLKVSEDMTTTGGSKYNPNTVFARRSVINQMKLKKDSSNNYMTPPFVSADGKNIDGMIVIETNVAPANTLVVCDRRFGKIYEKGGIELSKGLVGDQFIEDAMTLKARKRLCFLIRNADKGAFRKVTDITAALVTLAS